MSHIDSIPQIISIQEIKNGYINIIKDVRNHLDLKQNDELFLVYDEEFTISNTPSGNKIDFEKSRRIKIPEELIKKLSLSDGDNIALVQRKNAVSVKKLYIESKNSKKTGIVDIESPKNLTRTVYGRLEPEKELKLLLDQNKSLSLNYDPLKFFKNKETLEALLAREILGSKKPSDNELKNKLIQERANVQLPNGSWDNNLMKTANNLRELAMLNMGKQDPLISKGVEWIMNRPESPHNPGMFFLKEDLIREQINLVSEREKITKGSRPRFRKLLASENKNLIQGDNMVKLACGPRIMWPNSLVLETLLLLGYENHDRVRRILEFLKVAYWCECLYQHGDSDPRRPMQQVTVEEIERMEEEFLNQYKYLGLTKLGELTKIDLSRKVGLKLPRISHEEKNGINYYTLFRQDHVQGCELMTCRSLYCTHDKTLKRLVNAYLWRLASVQNDDGLFKFKTSSGKYQNNMFFDNQYGLLEFFSRFDHPASHLVIQRALPWMIENQNLDGSWGKEKPELTTLSVIKILNHN